MTRTRIPKPVIGVCPGCALDVARGHSCPHCTPAGARTDLGQDLDHDHEPDDLGQELEDSPDLGHDQDQGHDLGPVLYELRRIADALDLLTGRPGPVGPNPTTRLGETPA